MRFLVALLLLAGCPSSSPKKVVEPEPEPAKEARVEDNRLILPGTFVFDEMTLDAAASADALEAARAYLADRTDVTLVRIEGHTDGDGSEDDVMFSGERALQVGNWLIDHGIPCERMLIAGFGGTKPGWNEIEIMIAELRGLAIGGMPTDGSAPAAVPACP